MCIACRLSLVDPRLSDADWPDFAALRQNRERRAPRLQCSAESDVKRAAEKAVPEHGKSGE
jgi:hypothetical protein